MRRTITALVLVAACVPAAGCGGSSSSPKAAATSGPTGTIVVSAASSLKETFGTLARQFEAAHPGSKVTLNFAGSDALAAQISGGASVDVFAAASTKTMTTVVDAKDGIGAPVDFAKNQLEIAVPPGNPAKVTTLADALRPGVKLVVCAASVPCGAAATKAFAAAALTAKPVSLEQDVKSVLTKVELKEADAGLVYHTDVVAAGAKVTGVPFPEAAKALATYPIVAVRTGKNPTGAAAFIAYVLSAKGAEVLAAAGFLKP